jgi:hypothetical protein
VPYGHKEKEEPDATLSEQSAPLTAEAARAL